MAEIFFHLQSQQVEIRRIAEDEGHIHAMFFVDPYTHGHIDVSRNTAPHTCLCHKGKLLHLVLEDLHHIIVPGGVLDVVEVFRRGMHRPGKHMLHLHLHHKGEGDQEYRKDVLHHDEHFAQDHLVPTAERAFDDVDGLVTGCGDSREQSVDDAQNQDAGEVCQDIPGRQHKGKPYACIDAQHQFVRIAGGNQVVHHRDQEIGQQQGRRKAHGCESHGFGYVLP